MSNFTVPGENRGQKSKYLNGGGSLLLAGLPPIEPDDGVWSREELMDMNDRFVVALERAIAQGSNHPRRRGPLSPSRNF